MTQTSTGMFTTTLGMAGCFGLSANCSSKTPFTEPKPVCFVASATKLSMVPITVTAGKKGPILGPWMRGLAKNCGT